MTNAHGSAPRRHRPGRSEVGPVALPSQATHSTASTPAGSNTSHPRSCEVSMSPSGRSRTPSSGCSRSLRVQRELSPSSTSLTCPRLPITGSSRPMTTLPSTAPPYVPASPYAEHPRPPIRAPVPTACRAPCTPLVRRASAAPLQPPALARPGWRARARERDRTDTRRATASLGRAPGRALIPTPPGAKTGRRTLRPVTAQHHKAGLTAPDHNC
jgi:hypothetical protein